MRRMYFIVNPQAKNGQSYNVWKKVEKQLKQESVVYEVYFTEYSGHAKKLVQMIVKKLGEESALIIAVGGDGTVHEVANGSVGNKKIVIGYIPAGSGNDFARGFQIPHDTKKAVEYVLNERTLTNIDVGKVRLDGKETYFVNNLGAGFDAAICEEANQSRMKAKLNRLSLGSLAYAGILIRKLFNYKCTDMVVTIDGEEHPFTNVWFITVSNQVYFGGGMKIAPTAVVTDGLFNVTVVHHLSRWKLLFVFITVFWGGHSTFKEVSTFTGRKILIQSNQPVHVHADGEVIGLTPLQIQAYQQALTIVGEL